MDCKSGTLTLTLYLQCHSRPPVTKAPQMGRRVFGNDKNGMGGMVMIRRRKKNIIEEEQCYLFSMIGSDGNKTQILDWSEAELQ